MLTVRILQKNIESILLDMLGKESTNNNYIKESGNMGLKKRLKMKFLNNMFKVKDYIVNKDSILIHYTVLLKIVYSI